jgi:hypothetical protein
MAETSLTGGMLLYAAETIAQLLISINSISGVFETSRDNTAVAGVLQKQKVSLMRSWAGGMQENKVGSYLYRTNQMTSWRGSRGPCVLYVIQPDHPAARVSRHCARHHIQNWMNARFLYVRIFSYILSITASALGWGGTGSFRWTIHFLFVDKGCMCVSKSENERWLEWLDIRVHDLLRRVVFLRF